MLEAHDEASNHRRPDVGLLDLELERFFKALDERIGQGRYTVFLTADHDSLVPPSYQKHVIDSYAGPKRVVTMGGISRRKTRPKADAVIARVRWRE